MAQSKDNIITHGLSGKVGNLLVFSQRGGKTIVSKVPKSVEPKDGQVVQQKKFQQAVLYAKGAIADPSVKAIYEADAKEGKSGYNVAVADFFHAPDIEQVNLSAYTGKVGDTISIRVTDDFMVKVVSVSIYNEDGSLVEQGNAWMQATGMDWVFTATAQNESLAGDRIVIQASDLPGNLTAQEQILD